MTDGPDPAALAALSERLDALAGEVRRQGRAAIAAQAAAERCLELLQRLDAAPPGGAAPEPVWLGELGGVFDALGRAAEAGRALVGRGHRPRWLAWLPALRAEQREIAAVAAGLGLLEQRLDAALNRLGVTVDREVGCPVEGRRHRVVATVPGAGPPRVTRVLRPGYAVAGRVLREAEVEASAGPLAEPRGSEP